MVNQAPQIINYFTVQIDKISTIEFGYRADKKAPLLIASRICMDLRVARQLKTHLEKTIEAYDDTIKKS